MSTTFPDDFEASPLNSEAPHKEGQKKGNEASAAKDDMVGGLLIEISCDVKTLTV